MVSVPTLRTLDGVEAKRQLPTLCLRYPGQADFDCTGAFEYLRQATDSAPGDPFGLSLKPAPPFMLDRESTTLGALKTKAGL